MRFLMCVCAALMVGGCSSPPSSSVVDSPAPPNVTFKDVTEQVGLSFKHDNGMTGKKWMPETMGAGCAFMDYDNDGRLDILLVNGARWPGVPSSGAVSPQLFRNEGARFTEVTARVGLNVPMYGMGVVVGDYDNDGWDDLYVTAVGSCRLFHNENGRRFRDVTAQAGVASPGWATSATWIDYNRDGLLDLFVCHYVQWTPTTDRFFSVDGVNKSYATPQQYPGESCRLYHNDGGGRFRDVSKQTGIFNTRSKALGVVLCDEDQDGWPDLIVANDTEPNFLFHNQGGDKPVFKEVALELGIARAETGKAKAGMGIDTGDEQNSGQDAIVITNFAGEQLSLYRRDASGQYLDAAARSGIGNASQLYLGFGVFFFDYDSDGWLDLLVANGHIQDDAFTRQTGVRYEEPALLLHNMGEGMYRDVTAPVGSALLKPEVRRGAAWGDYDNDGYPDVLLTANNGPARLLRNENGIGNHWLRVELEGTKSNRNAVGARVRVKVGDRAMTRTVKGGSSYLSQSDRRLLFGLGQANEVDAVEIQWPSGQVQILGRTSVDQTLKVKEEAGQ